MSEHAPDSAPAASVCSGLHAHAGILVCVTEPLSYLARHKPLAALPPGGSSPIKGLSSSAPLTGGVKSRGDHGCHQHPAVGKDMRQRGGRWARSRRPRAGPAELGGPAGEGQAASSCARRTGVGAEPCNALPCLFSSVRQRDGSNGKIRSDGVDRTTVGFRDSCPGL